MPAGAALDADRSVNAIPDPPAAVKSAAETHLPAELSHLRT